MKQWVQMKQKVNETEIKIRKKQFKTELWD